MTDEEIYALKDYLRNQISEKKKFLANTDFHVIKALETDSEEDATIKSQRAQARTDINTLEAQIADLE